MHKLLLLFVALIVNTREVDIYIYIAKVLKTRSNLAAKSKVQLLPLAAVALTVSFKFLGGAASWLVACKSNKYEVLVTRPLYGKVREGNLHVLGKAIRY